MGTRAVRIFTNARWIQRSLSKNIAKAIVIVIVYGDVMRFIHCTDNSFTSTKLIVWLQVPVFFKQFV